MNHIRAGGCKMPPPLANLRLYCPELKHPTLQILHYIWSHDQSTPCPESVVLILKTIQKFHWVSINIEKYSYIYFK